MTEQLDNYRERLTEMVRMTGLYILRHADEIVDHADLKVGFTINITYENEEAPTIEISQSHIMREVMEVQFGKQQK